MAKQSGQCARALSHTGFKNSLEQEGDAHHVEGEEEKAGGWVGGRSKAIGYQCTALRKLNYTKCYTKWNSFWLPLLEFIPNNTACVELKYGLPSVKFLMQLTIILKKLEERRKLQQTEFLTIKMFLYA